MIHDLMVIFLIVIVFGWIGWIVSVGLPGLPIPHRHQKGPQRPPEPWVRDKRTGAPLYRRI